MLLASVILIIPVLLSFAILIFLTDRLLGGLDFTSGKKIAKDVAQIIKQRNLESGNFYDLGSCRGGFAIKIAGNFPQLQVNGIDDSRFRVFLAQARSLFLKNIQFKTGNIFMEDVSAADIVYLYLPQELMPALEIKLQKELKPGSLAVSASVSFPNWPPAQVYHLDQTNLKVPKLFIYQQI